MGQKIHPHGARVGVIKDWDARWFADKKQFSGYLIEDNKIRVYLKKKHHRILRGIMGGPPRIFIMDCALLGGAAIARTESYHEGSIPLQTLRADIQYGFAEAKTTYGRIGCKVWIYRGEIMPKTFRAQMRQEVPVQRNEPRPERRDRGERGERRQRPARRPSEGGRR